VFTNHPHHYATEDQADPRRHLFSVISIQPRVAIEQAASWQLHHAADLYGNIPNAFPSQQ
jgi:hypothetical protein